MLLTIDCGNTEVVFGVFEGDECRGQWRTATVAHKTSDEYAVWIAQLMSLKGLTAADISDAIVASVVPAALFDLKTLCRNYFGCSPMVVGDSGVNLGIQVLVDRPEQVGADRLVNAVAAKERYKGPNIIIDFGTATTFDALDEDGNYVGGVIAPGVNLSIEALHMAAAKLPLIGIEVPVNVIGKATVPAMHSGVYWGYVGLIEGLVKRIAEEYGKPMTVVATGGLAPVFDKATPLIQHVDQDLTLRGLVLVHRLNQPRQGERAPRDDSR